MATHCGRTDYWLISYLDYDNYKDYDDFDKDYDDNYDDYDGDYDVLNLTQLLMQNSHSLLLSNSIITFEYFRTSLAPFPLNVRA